MENNKYKVNDLPATFIEAAAVARERILKVAKTLLGNRNPLFLGEDKEYLYISNEQERWWIRHTIQESNIERKEVVCITGWVRYEDLNVTATIEDYNGTKRPSISITGIN